MRRLGFGVVALVVALVQGVDSRQRQSSAVRLSLPDWAGDATCHLRRGLSGVLQPLGDGTAACQGEPGLVSCDGSRIEPVDVLSEVLCHSGTIPILPADGTASIRTDSPVTVEWLDWLPGDRVQTITTRQFRGPGVMAVPFNRNERRLIRFSRAGASPVSIPVERLAAVAWELPPAKSGGEILARVPRAAIVARDYRIDGPVQVAFTREDDFLGVGGLPEGRYNLHAVYGTGSQGPAIPISVRGNGSSYLTLPVEQVGAVRVIVDAASCVAGTVAAIYRVSEDRAAITRSRLATTSTADDCTWTLDGLVPGTHEVQIQGPSGRLGSRKFTVQPQRIENVQMSLGVIEASGTVSWNQKPFAGVDIEFLHTQKHSVSARVKTDESGRYSLRLEEPGRYLAMAREGNAILARKEMLLVPGSNPTEWTIVGGEIRIRVRGHRSEQPVVVRIQSSTLSLTEVLRPGADAEIVKHGLPFTKYQVSATQDGLSSALVEAGIDVTKPSATIDLEMREMSRSLLLTDTSGVPLSNATIRTVGVQNIVTSAAVTETAPGVYQLQDLAPGTRLSIRAAGKVPVCRVVPAAGDLAVALETGRRIEVDLPSDVTVAAMRVVAFNERSLESCPLPLTEFQPHVQSVDGQQPVRVRIEHFSSSTDLFLERAGRVRRVVVPSSGAITVVR